jgi:hypothetical protein
MNIKPATAGKPRQLYQTLRKLKSGHGQMEIYAVLLLLIVRGGTWNYIEATVV